MWPNGSLEVGSQSRQRNAAEAVEWPGVFGPQSPASIPAVYCVVTPPSPSPFWTRVWFYFLPTLGLGPFKLQRLWLGLLALGPRSW